MITPDDLLQRLDAFSARDREEALRSLAVRTAFPPEGGNVNLHAHSFFSFNAAGASPSRIAFDARRAGLWAAGLCDFDVLDGLEEFFRAGLILGLRTTVHLETRAYFPEYAAVEINSPGEPGVTYIMGGGFPAVPPPSDDRGRFLTMLRRRAADRNRALIERINARVPAIAIDYRADVLPLTPAAAPTERHIIRAYCRKAAVVFPADRGAAFWAETLGLSRTEAEGLVADSVALEEKVRSRFVKKGGIGYEPPTAQTFPPVADFIAWVLACDAIPLVTWLDGTSAGESDPAAMLDTLVAKGAEGVNIIPDRNWNLSDPAAAARKREKLREFVSAVEARHLPINIGTELNRDGLPFADDLNGPVLSAYRGPFQRGAAIMIGHTWLARYARFPYCGEQARAEFGQDRPRKNRFFESVGRLPPLTEATAERLRETGPERAFRMISDSARAGRWIV
jgi:hypothetical protein